MPKNGIGKQTASRPLAELLPTKDLRTGVTRAYGVMAFLTKWTIVKVAS